jgi:hypothetical protein
MTDDVANLTLSILQDVRTETAARPAINLLSSQLPSPS